MLHKRSIKEKLLKGGAWALSGRLVTALSGLAISVLLARLLTPEEMGAYFLTFSLVSVAAVVAQLGLTQTVVRLVAESMGAGQESRAKRSVLLVLRLVVFGGVMVACLLVFGGGKWISEQLFESTIMSQIVGFATVWAVLLAFQNVMAEVYRGFHDIRLATIFGGLTTSMLTMGMFLGLWLVQGHSQLNQIVMVTVGAGLSSVMLSSVVLWNRLKLLPSEGNNNVSTLEVLRISWPLWVSQLMILVVMQASIWVTGVFLNEEDVALYGAAMRLVTLLMITTSIFYSFMPPIITEMKINNELLKLQSILTTTAFANGLLILPIFLIFIFLPELVLNIIYGVYYEQAGAVLSILAVSVFFNVITGMRGIVLMLTGHEKKQMVISVIGGIMNISFCIFGAWKFGMVGIAYGAMFGTILQVIMEFFAVKKFLGIWTNATPIYFREFINIYTSGK